MSQSQQLGNRRKAQPMSGQHEMAMITFRKSPIGHTPLVSVDAIANTPPRHRGFARVWQYVTRLGVDMH